MRKTLSVRARVIRWTSALLSVMALVVGAQGADTSKVSPDVRRTLAPTGSLRVALYVGTATSLMSEHDLRGVGYDLGRQFALRLGVPFEPVVFVKNADALNAMKTGRADVAFTNASAERAEYMDFTQSYLFVELGYLTRPGGSVVSLKEVDRPGVRVGVTAKSSSDAELSHRLKYAQLIRTDTAEDGVKMLAGAKLDVYATNKAILAGMASQLPGATLLEGNWGLERHALGLPKGREAGLPFARAFIADAVMSGQVAAAVERVGLKGASIPDAGKR